jgi:hypothetical protein
LAVATAPAEAGNGKAALAKLPKETSMVLTVNVDRAKKSSLFADAMKLAKQNPDMAKGIDLLKAQASFDVSRDVRTLVVGFDKDFDKTEKAVVLVEGKFNPKKFVKFAKASANKVVDLAHRGIKYYEINGESDMALIKGYMVVTPKGHMKHVIDVHKGKAPGVTRNAEFMKMYKGADTSKDLWFVGVLPQSVRSQAKGMLGGNTVDGLTASVDIRKGLSTSVKLAASSSAGAQQLAGLMQMGLMQGAGDPSLKALGLADAVKKVKIKANAKNVDIDFSLTNAELQKIKNLLKNFL